jgi:hypothetical protein
MRQLKTLADVRELMSHFLFRPTRTPGDGLIIFQGMQDHTAESIKSLEGYRIAQKCVRLPRK